MSTHRSSLFRPGQRRIGQEVPLQGELLHRTRVKAKGLLYAGVWAPDQKEVSEERASAFFHCQLTRVGVRPGTSDFRFSPGEVRESWL